MRSVSRIRLHIPALTFCLLPAPAASAQNYPAHPIRMVVPFPAGGSIDIVSRSIAQRWSPHLGQQFVIDNRAGAAGTIIQAIGVKGE